MITNKLNSGIEAGVKKAGNSKLSKEMDEKTGKK